MHNKWWEISGVSLLMLALAVFSTYPLIQYFDTAIPYSAFGGAKVWNRSGDQIQLLYWFWLVKENFLGTIPFDSNPFEFNMGFPYDTSGLNTIPLAFLYMIFSPFGDVTAYNCTIFSSYVLAGLFMYLLIKLYSDSRLGALLGAIIFTLAPSRVNGFTAGHGYGFLYFCYPFILYYLEKGIRTAEVRFGIISSIGLVGLAMLEPHLIYYICLFLGVYIPIRVLTFFPVLGYDEYRYDEGYSTWRLVGYFALIWGAGISATFYAQSLFACRDLTPLFTETFGLMTILYPLIFLLVSFVFAAVYQRLSDVKFNQCITIEAYSLLPLYLFLPLSVVACYFYPLKTGVLVAASFVTVVVLKLWLLRSVLLSMLKKLLLGLHESRKSIYPILPLIFAMGGVVYWMSFSKVEQVAATITGGGRTLHDVGRLSASLSDVFLSTSNVYIGVVPAGLASALLLVLLASAVSGKKSFRFVSEVSLIRLFYLLIAFCCFILALGLAFGHISLYALFFHYFPFFNYPRVSDRIITLSLFALAIVAGFVVRKIQDRWSGRLGELIVTALIIASILFQFKDYNTAKPMGINILDRGQDIYSYVKENIGEGLLLEIPLWPGDSHQSSLYQHYIMLDRVPRINGSSPMVLKKYIDTVFEPLASINQGRLDREQFEKLHQLGVKFITVHDNEDVFPRKVSPFVPLTTVRRLQNSPFLEYIEVDNTMHFKTWKGPTRRLFLFKVKDQKSVNLNSEQAWYDMPYFYNANWKLHNETGKVVKDRSINTMVFQAIENQDTPGLLIYGPDDVYSPGKYRCSYTIKLDGKIDSKAARLEICRVEGNGDITVIAQKELNVISEVDGYKVNDIDFAINDDTKLQFRVFYNGVGQVSVEKIAVVKRGNDPGTFDFLKAEMMVGNTGLIAFEEQAKTGKVVQAVAGKSEKGEMVYGPNRMYNTGHYNVRFWLRNKGTGNIAKNDTLAVVSVTDEKKQNVFVKHEVKIGELSTQDFSSIDLDIELKRDQFLSFIVHFTGKTTIQLDGIEVIRR